MFKQNLPRRPRMLLHAGGMTYLWRRNPYLVIWWSAAFPGFGHMLLNQFGRGILLTLSEVIINTLGRVNEAIVYTLCGQFEMAKATLQPRWMYGYLIVYFFAIWSSYHAVFSMNRLSHLAELDNSRMASVHLYPLEIQYIERKNPVIGTLWSFAFPGLGQIYNQRIVIGVYALAWWWIKATLAHLYDSLFLLLNGHLTESIAILDRQWLLFMPSVWGGTIYYTYISTIEQNHIFKLEQKQFFAERYQGESIRIFPDKGNGQC